MGWDNASTVAQEVENPQKQLSPRHAADAVIVALSYMLPLAAIAVAGMAIAQFTTGSWTDAATRSPVRGWRLPWSSAA